MRRVLALMVVLVCWSTAQPAMGSCVALPPLAESFASAPVVFVGTVVATTDRLGRAAEVHVTTVWKGEVASIVTVTGGPDLGPNITTSNDRHFSIGDTYAFFPVNGRNPFEDNGCTATTVLTPSLEIELESLAGGPGHEPIAAPAAAAVEGNLFWPWIAGLSVVAGTLAVLGRRRRVPSIEGFRLNRGGGPTAGPD